MDIALGYKISNHYYHCSFFIRKSPFFKDQNEESDESMISWSSKTQSEGDTPLTSDELKAIDSVNDIQNAFILLNSMNNYK